jgi:hypothetical protein
MRAANDYITLATRELENAESNADASHAETQRMKAIVYALLAVASAVDDVNLTLRDKE